MKNILNFAAAMLIGCLLLSCDNNKENEEILNTTKSIEIEIDSNGGKYTFASNTIDVIVSPDGFNAEVVNNTIVGKYAGTTSATIKSDNTTYECEIKVEPSYTYYIDMAIYFGFSKSAIEKIYGSSISVSSATYYYNPLSTYMTEEKVAFTYDDNDEVTACAAYFSTSQMTYVIKHLQERYAYYTLNNSIAYYGNALEMDDASIIIVCGIETGAVIYASADLLNS